MSGTVNIARSIFDHAVFADSADAATIAVNDIAVAVNKTDFLIFVIAHGAIARVNGADFFLVGVTHRAIAVLIPDDVALHVTNRGGHFTCKYNTISTQEHQK